MQFYINLLTVCYCLKSKYPRKQYIVKLVVDITAADINYFTSQ